MAEVQETEDLDMVLAASIMSKMKSLTYSRSSTCIYRVPEKLRTVKEKAYAPEIVSIGPFHRGKPNLQALEDTKEFNLLYVLDRASSLSLTIECLLENLVRAVRNLEIEARGCYAERTVEHMSSDEFVEMMVRDGCFIVQLLQTVVDHGGIRDTMKNDPIYLSLQHDLILLENQIPFVVLEKIFRMTSLDPRYIDISITDQLLLFFKDMLPAPAYQEVRQERLNMEFEKPKHLLDFFHVFLLPLTLPDYVVNIFAGSGSTHRVIDLCKAGLTFKRNEDPDGLLDIQFNSKEGIFKIPPFFIKGSADVLLRNLVAMEQCDIHFEPHFTSYVLLLGILIKSERDVTLLCRKGIVHSCLGDDEEMAVMINDLCKGVSPRNFYYAQLCDACNTYVMAKGRRKWSSDLLKLDYFNIRWHRWKVMLKRDYFNSPWAVFSFIAATSLVVLTFLQTFYAIYAYHHPPPP